MLHNIPKGTSEIEYDYSVKANVRRVHLDDESLCFLKIYPDEHSDMNKYSFDIEAASDSHYLFNEASANILRKHLSADNNTPLEDVLINALDMPDGYSKVISALKKIGALQFHYD